MADIPIRTVVAEHLVDLLAGHELLGGVQVEDGYPGELAVTGPEVVWLQEIETQELGIPLGMAGPKIYDDTFDAHLLSRVAGRASRRETGRRLAEIHTAILQVLAEDPTLDDLDGVVSAELTANDWTPASPTPDGFLGFGRSVVTVHTRITPSEPT